MNKEKNYSSGYFLRDESGYSVVRSSFRTIEKAKQYAIERGLKKWTIVGFNWDKMNWDILAKSEDE